MTPTPTQIATEAAEAYYKQMNEYCMAERERRPDLAALIIAAAAKMVQQTGAVEVLEAHLERGLPITTIERIGHASALSALRSISEGEARPSRNRSHD